MERHSLKQPPLEISKLVLAAKAGDETALPELIALTQTRLYRFLLFLTTSDSLAKDICQDTFLYVFENIAKLEKPEAFQHWLFVIARHKFLDHKKSPRSRAYTPVETLEKNDEGTAPEKRQLIMEVRETFATLEPEERLILTLVDVEGYSLKETAEFMKISEAAATSRLRRARAGFHKKFYGE